jgi:hypothetical protein
MKTVNERLTALETRFGMYAGGLVPGTTLLRVFGLKSGVHWLLDKCHNLNDFSMERPLKNA